MALGRRDPQRGLFEASMRFRFDLDKLGLYGKLAEHGAQIFKDDDFEALYKEGGRPSAPPSLKAIALLLQHFEGVSDDEVIARLQFDLRWKVALNLDPLSLSSPFVKSTYQAFRAGLVLNEKEAIVLEKSLEKACAAGVFPNELRTALDSTPIRGRGAVKDTFNLLSDAIRKVVRSIAEKTKSEPADEARRLGASRHFAGSVKGSEDLDWTKEEEKRAFLGRLLEDCDRVVSAAKKARCGGEAVELLEKIVEQNVDRTTPLPSIPKRVAEDRVVSVSDPEIRHGHKSSGKIYSGHKAHVAVEITTGLITAVDLGKPGEADGTKVKALVEQTNQSTGSKVQTAIGDTAYSSTEANKQASDLGVVLRTKMPTTSRAGKFGADEFTVSPDGTRARCPANHLSVSSYRQDDARVHRWDPTLCAACPLRVRCTDAEARTLRVGPNFHERRRREKWARSRKGREVLRERVVVEHAIAGLKNMGAAASRYFGRAKTKLQLLWTAGVMNLTALFRLGVFNEQATAA